MPLKMKPITGDLTNIWRSSSLNLCCWYDLGTWKLFPLGTSWRAPLTESELSKLMFCWGPHDMASSSLKLPWLCREDTLFAVFLLHRRSSDNYWVRNICKWLSYWLNSICYCMLIDPIWSADVLVRIDSTFGKLKLCDDVPYFIMFYFQELLLCML